MVQQVTIGLPPAKDGYISLDDSAGLIQLARQLDTDVKLESHNIIISSLKKLLPSTKLRLSSGDTVKLSATGDNSFESVCIIANYLMGK